uniref:Hpt domain-containing protein n=1 Tax=Candidatus Electrothrix sp. TaxID=2170559 RepID=UPI00405676C2
SSLPSETEEEDDLFASALAGLSEHPEKSDNLFDASSATEADQNETDSVAIDPELLECFREETEEHLENIDRCLNSLEEHTTDLITLTPSSQETLHSLRRSVHTLKGAAAVIGIEQVAAWGHDFEDFLDWLHDEAQQLDPTTLAALRDGSDLLASLAETPGLAIAKEKQRITTQFEDIIKQFSSHPVGPDKQEAETKTSSFIAEEPDEADSFFDEFSSLPSETEEEDDLFASALAGLSEHPEKSDNLFDTPSATEADQNETGFVAIDPELLECFREETEEHLENIDYCLNQLTDQVSGPTELCTTTRETLHSLRRSVHTLKGAAAVIGIEQVAAWGHDFEDFLDWLHDEAGLLSPSVIALLREGTDLLTELSENPAISVEKKKNDLNAQFNIIIADHGSLTNQQTPFVIKEKKEPTNQQAGNDSSGENIDEELLQYFHEETKDSHASSTDEIDLPPVEEDRATPSEQISEQKPTQKFQTTPAQQQRTKSATLRVDINRIDQMVGLSGDMVINLSSFEDSMDTMSGTMNELDMILQRLKNINSSLEAGYELASIPHLGSSDDGQSSELNQDFDPLEMDKYSELNILIRSLTEAVSDLDSIMTQNTLDNVIWQKTVEQQSMVLKELQNRMMGIRMTPFSTLSGRMQRTVREAARTTGHPAQLTIKGESIMMDTRVWDVMADPLMHILRNAVAHGGSSPKQGNKSPLAITITARRKGGLCTLQVSDNGKGLDYEAIRIKGMKLYPDDRVNLMSDNELADLIFRHGFSSTGTITNIAGRGVGMDVVRDGIDQLNGSIELISEQGQGTTFIMRLPVAVAQLPAILARFGAQVYALPMHDVESVVRATSEEKKSREYNFDGENIPLLHPAEIPGFETGRIYTQENLTEEDQALLVVHAGRKRAAILCEQLIGQRDIVFKDLGNHLHNVPCISGVTIMGDGSLIPILQVEEILRTWTSTVTKQDKGIERRAAQSQALLRVLVVDDSISVRKVVSNLITQQGWLPVSARNGIEAIEKIRDERPDIVLLDVEMPRMNGFEVLQALQAQPELRDIPVAMLTSRSAEKYQNKARELGARGFMNKPFKADEVISFIRKVTSSEKVESY